MALVSPGIQISINDQSQYVNSNIGSVPLVVLATAQDKLYNGAAAIGTSKSNAGQLLSFSSQRDLVTRMGTPTFQLSSTGTPINASELNEYGLLAAYSALGIGNQLYAIRADIDLNQLKGTSVRPTSAVADGTYWLDLASTEFGIYALTSTGEFSHISPLLITDPAQVTNDNSYAYDVPTPNTSVGNVGQYALVFVDPVTGMAPDAIRLFYKAGTSAYDSLANTWVQVGSSNWQQSIPTLTGTQVLSGLTNSTLYSITINSVNVEFTASTTDALTRAALVSAINASALSAAGVTASLTGTGLLELYATSSAPNGAIVVSTGGTSGGATPLTLSTASGTLGITAGTYYSPYFFYGTFAQEPTSPVQGWSSRPAGSVWWKTTSTAGGFNAVLKKYSAASASWVTETVPFYINPASAIYALDPVTGGANITPGTTISTYSVTDTTANNLKFAVFTGGSIAAGTGGQLLTATPFTSGDQIRITATLPGSPPASASNFGSIATITISGTGPLDFVQAILNANIPYVTATYNPNDGTYGSITITHTAGGQIGLINVTTAGSVAPLTSAQFISGKGTNLYFTATGVVLIDNVTVITTEIQYQTNTPYTAPSTGTLWYYSNPADVDIMINNNGWKGYRVAGTDIRGYALGSTDPNGVIPSAGIAPTTQSDGVTAVARGDLWLDTSDLVNYPKLYRYNGASWTAIDNTDHTSQNGIVFADARWDNTGTTDPVTGSFPAISTLVSSSYIDQDAPDYRLYPRGTLLFNTRRSGYNVKKYVPDYFNSTSFPTLPAVPGATSNLPTVTGTWVTASGLDENGVMYSGSAAQRDLVVAAMRSAVDSNTQAIEDIYNFNLLACPGYPEVTANLVNLNNNRANTGFIIADTPLTLVPDVVTITDWVNNTTGNGLPSVTATDPYTGVYYPAGLTNDLAGNSVVVPASHAVLRTFLYNDQVSYPWFAPAGVNRGLVSNLNDVGYVDAASGAFIHNGINQGLRDGLYPLDINPIAQIPNIGIVVWGQRTRNGSTTSRSSVNVVRLENYLRTVFKSVANGYLFEPNDTVTRKSIARQIEGALNDVLSKRGVYDFLVICDSSNNTAATIANQQLYVDVAIEPMRDVEFIYIPIALYNPGEIASLNVSST